MRLALGTLLAAALLLIPNPMALALNQVDLSAINLSATDVGPNYTLDEDLSGPVELRGVDMHSAVFERQAALLQQPGPYVVASLLATSERGMSLPYLTAMVGAMTQDNPLVPAEGPEVGSDTSWYRVTSEEAGIPREEHIVAFIAGDAAVMVLTVGVGGRSDQEDTAGFARLLASRLE